MDLMRQANGERELTTMPYRNEYLNSKPGRQTDEAQEMDTVTS